MKRLSIGIDAHKVSNLIGLAFNDMEDPILYGKVSADLNRTVGAVRKILKKQLLQNIRRSSGWLSKE